MSTLNVTNIKAADGTSSLSIANSTGVVTTSAGFNNYASASSGGGTTINPTLTDIPSWANEITVAFFDVSGSSTTDTIHRVAVGGSVITSGYQYTSSYYQNNTAPSVSDRSSTGDAGFMFYGWTNAANNFNGTLTYTKTGNHKYVVEGHHYNQGYPAFTMKLCGRISLSGHISGISLYNSTNFDGGEVRVLWR